MEKKITELTKELREMAKNPLNTKLADFCRKHTALVDALSDFAMSCEMSKAEAEKLIEVFCESILR